MNNYPLYAQIGNKKYKINTDYKVTLRCDEIARSGVSDTERGMAIIYLLFGDKGLKDSQNWEELLKIALKYLRCGKETDENNNQDKEVSMDFKQDWEYIKTSFFYDYKIKLTKNKYMHWWEFYNLLCGLSEKCILNRVRFIRDFDISQIKDGKEKQKWIEQKQQVVLKRTEEKTSEEIRLDKLFEKQMKGE